MLAVQLTSHAERLCSFHFQNGERSFADSSARLNCRCRASSSFTAEACTPVTPKTAPGGSAGSPVHVIVSFSSRFLELSLAICCLSLRHPADVLVRSLCKPAACLAAGNEDWPWRSCTRGKHLEVSQILLDADMHTCRLNVKGGMLVVCFILAFASVLFP